MNTVQMKRELTILKNLRLQMTSMLIEMDGRIEKLKSLVAEDDVIKFPSPKK